MKVVFMAPEEPAYLPVFFERVVTALGDKVDSDGPYHINHDHRVYCERSARGEARRVHVIAPRSHTCQAYPYESRNYSAGRGIW